MWIRGNQAKDEPKPPRHLLLAELWNFALFPARDPSLHLFFLCDIGTITLLFQFDFVLSDDGKRLAKAGDQ
jgi:hypothetical protein